MRAFARLALLAGAIFSPLAAQRQGTFSARNFGSAKFRIARFSAYPLWSGCLTAIAKVCRRRAGYSRTMVQVWRNAPAMSDERLEIGLKLNAKRRDPSTLRHGMTRLAIDPTRVRRSASRVRFVRRRTDSCSEPLHNARLSEASMLVVARRRVRSRRGRPSVRIAATTHPGRGASGG